MFASKKPVVAMIHVEALPGTPASRLGLREIETQALAEAKIYREAGAHAISLENMHDLPYLRGGVGSEIVASMALLSRAVKDASGVGSHFKVDGYWANAVDPKRVERFMAVHARLGG